MSKSINIKELDDISLIEQLCQTKNQEAYKEFINRYYDIVKDQALLKCKMRKLDSHIGEEIAHKTFERILKTNSFNRNRLNNSDPQKAIKAWLYRIMNNLFYDYHKETSKSLEKPINSYFDNLAIQFKESNPSELLNIKDFAKTVFSKLSKKEKEVVLTDIEYKKGRKYLPPDINESLAVRIGVKTVSVRKIRERAITKIKLAIDEFNK